MGEQNLKPDDGFCSVRDDKIHCNCWWRWDGEPCCSCGHIGSDDDPSKCDACELVLNENEDNPESIVDKEKHVKQRRVTMPRARMIFIDDEGAEFMSEEMELAPSIAVDINYAAVTDDDLIKRIHELEQEVAHWHNAFDESLDRRIEVQVLAEKYIETVAEKYNNDGKTTPKV